MTGCRVLIHLNCIVLQSSLLHRGSQLGFLYTPQSSSHSMGTLHGICKYLWFYTQRYTVSPRPRSPRHWLVWYLVRTRGMFPFQSTLHQRSSQILEARLSAVVSPIGAWCHWLWVLSGLHRTSLEPWIPHWKCWWSCRSQPHNQVGSQWFFRSSSGFVSSAPAMLSRAWSG